MTTDDRKPEPGQHPNQPQLAYPVQYPYLPDDEIDLFELFEGLWRRKGFIVVFTAVCAALSILWVLFFTSPTYEVSAQLRPPALADLAPLRAQLNEELLSTVVTIPTPESAFRQLQDELGSRHLQRRVFKKLLTRTAPIVPWTLEEISSDITEDQLFVEDFLPRLSFRAPDSDKAGASQMIGITFETQNPAAGSEVIQELIDGANKNTTQQAATDFTNSVKEAISSLEAQLSARVEQVKQRDLLEIQRLQEIDETKSRELVYQIEELRKSNATRRQDRITLLTENLSIAETLGIEDPVEFQDLKSRSRDQVDGLSVDLIAENKPLYLRGTRLLRAEIETLKNRDNDDFTSPQLRALENELALLNNNPLIEQLQAREDYSAFAEGGDALLSQINSFQAVLGRDLSKLNYVRIDLPPIIPSKPTAPNKKLIVTAITLAGGMFALVLALMLNVIEKRRTEIASR